MRRRRGLKTARRPRSADVRLPDGTLERWEVAGLEGPVHHRDDWQLEVSRCALLGAVKTKRPPETNRGSFG